MGIVINLFLIIFASVVFFAAGFFIGRFFLERIGTTKVLEAEERAVQIVQEAQKEANEYKELKVTEVNQEWKKKRREFDQEVVIKNLNDELGLTVVLVEHRLSLLSAYVKRIIVMDEGQVRLDGAPLDVLMAKEARALGIGIPQIMQLHQSLVENKVRLEKPATSVDEFAAMIRSLLQR